jgi:hypothetical protein
LDTALRSRFTSVAYSSLPAVGSAAAMVLQYFAGCHRECNERAARMSCNTLRFCRPVQPQRRGKGFKLLALLEIEGVATPGSPEGVAACPKLGDGSK